jgi:hypothetical protein
MEAVALSACALKDLLHCPPPALSEGMPAPNETKTIYTRQRLRAPEPVGQDERTKFGSNVEKDGVELSALGGA